jgi:hypothetical protein
VPCPGPAAAGRPLPPQPRPVPLRPNAGPHLPASRLPEPGSVGRPRPRGSARATGSDRLCQPLLPLPTAPSAEDPCPRVAVRHVPGRHALGDHAQRDHPHHATTGYGTTTGSATASQRGDPRRPALLTRILLSRLFRAPPSSRARPRPRRGPIMRGRRQYSGATALRWHAARRAPGSCVARATPGRRQGSSWRSRRPSRRRAAARPRDARARPR